jgi:hypothetical protein
MLQQCRHTLAWYGPYYVYERRRIYTAVQIEVYVSEACDFREHGTA